MEFRVTAAYTCQVLEDRIAALDNRIEDARRLHMDTTDLRHRRDAYQFALNLCIKERDKEQTHGD